MITNILKQGIPFAIAMALINIILDYSNGTLANENLLTKYIIPALITGLIFGTIMALYNRYKEKKRT